MPTARSSRSFTARVWRSISCSPAPGWRRWRSAARRAKREAIDGVVVPVAHATDLVVMKVLAGRGKDLEDLRSLLASGDTDLEEARDLLGQLERALGQPDLLPLLEQAIQELKG